ncbi:MAG TPA: type II toxin-antitoxin system PemK/MazF family toxin [Rhizomicrobium sp.]
METRPVIVVSYRNTLYGPCLVVPTSTDPQEGNKWAHKLSVTFDDVQSWAVCNQPSTIAPSRLSQFKGRIPLVPQADFDAVLRLLLQWIPAPRDH